MFLAAIVGSADRFLTGAALFSTRFASTKRRLM